MAIGDSEPQRMTQRSRSSLLRSLLLLLCALAAAAPLGALAQDDIAAPPTPPRMRVVINADGTASVVPETEAAAAATAVPDGVILPGLSDSASGLVPQWMLEQERAERQRKQEEQERIEREEMQRQKQEADARAFAEAQEERKRRQREETEQDRQHAAASGSADDSEAANVAAFLAAERRSKERQRLQLEQTLEAERARGTDSDAYRDALAALESWIQREQERDERMRQDEIERQAAAAAADTSTTADAAAAAADTATAADAAAAATDTASTADATTDAERAAAAERDRIVAADEIAAAAARAFAEQGLVKIDDASTQVAGHDPAQALFDALGRSAFFREILPHNAWSLVQAGRPFFMLLLCRCPADDMLDIATFENLLVDTGLHHRFSFLWAQAPTTHRFQMANTYSVDLGAPQLVIDNIPIGQHVEKYVFSGARLARPATATPQDLLRFAQAFLQAPSPLTMVARSAPRPEQSLDVESDRGKVFEVVGDTFREIVLESSVSVLLLFYSPHCPGCISAHPVLNDLAERLAWSNRGVIVARMDRTANDVPLVIRFSSYPALFLFQAGLKVYDSASDGGEEIERRGMRGSRGYRTPLNYHDEFPRDQGGGESCNAPLNVADLEAFVQRNTGAGNLLGTPMQQQQPQSKSEEEQQQQAQQPHPSAEQSAPSTPTPVEHVHATAAQQAGVAM